MKNLTKLLLVLSLTVLLSACTSKLSSNKGQEVETSTETEVSMENAKSAEEIPTPTLNSDNSIDSIEADLKATSILDEDFSDIK